MKIVYNSPKDVKEFSLERYYKSLNRYGEVSKEQIREALEKLTYNPMHYSVLVEEGVKLLPDEDSAKRYYDDHRKDIRAFSRLRRITGYLVGTLERWNDGKKAEEHDRVKHSVNGVYSVKEKKVREFAKREELMEQQDEYGKKI